MTILTQNMRICRGFASILPEFVISKLTVEIGDKGRQGRVTSHDQGIWHYEVRFDAEAGKTKSHWFSTSQLRRVEKTKKRKETGAMHLHQENTEFIAFFAICQPCVKPCGPPTDGLSTLEEAPSSGLSATFSPESGEKGQSKDAQDNRIEHGGRVGCLRLS
ncbi:MAG: hypothetical protein WKF77_07660 [Planctomycetaceae bacterium]